MTGYLFDTDAISETLKSQPIPSFVAWGRQIPQTHQFTSSIVIGELFAGAFRTGAARRHLKNIEDRILPTVIVLPYDVPEAKIFGKIRAALEDTGLRLEDPDLQIAATAIVHDLEVVTGNIRHFERIPGIRVCHALADARAGLHPR